ncbi:MAG: T9SS type A sorting domain-containing protein [Ignavibacteriaceae bacterium]|nr:T9SS type A sorting domain-containing protein [Ignavibacteriaceae bacterium]
MVKKLLVLFFLLMVSSPSNAQWQQTWSSGNINYNNLSGWANFDKGTDGWAKRLYLLDTLKFQIMQQGYSTIPEYTYTFNDAERLAGYQIYSLSNDLTNDGHPEFYILSYYGTSENYRQAFKIFDITTGTTLLEKDDANFYYTYPTIWDMDNNGTLECLVTKYEYPTFANFSFEVYSTGLVSSKDVSSPEKFELKQNFPNPFNPTTEINFSIETNQPVTLKIFDIKGELIRTLVNETMSGGSHTITWNGTNDKGIRQATGVYFYELRSEAKFNVKKMLLLK